MNNHQQQTYFFLILFIIIGILGFFIFLPYLSILAVSATFAVIFRPAYTKILSAFKDKHPGLAAFLTIIIAIGIIFVPLVVFGFAAFGEAKNLYLQLTDNGGSGITHTLKAIEYQLSILVPGVSFKFIEYIKQFFTWIAQNLGGIFSGITQTVVSIFLGLIAFYYFLKDGKKFTETLINLSPLPDTYDKEILERLEIAVNSVIKGTLVIALLQGILTGIGLAIFGVPNSALLGSITAISALLPGIGTALTLVPATLFLFFSGKLSAALGLAIWGIVIVGLIDNFLRPYIIERGIRIHPFLILISVLGGLSFFGISGFLLGPLVLSLIFTLGEIHSNLFKKID